MEKKKKKIAIFHLKTCWPANQACYFPSLHHRTLLTKIRERRAVKGAQMTVKMWPWTSCVPSKWVFNPRATFSMGTPRTPRKTRGFPSLLSSPFLCEDFPPNPPQQLPCASPVLFFFFPSADMREAMTLLDFWQRIFNEPYPQKPKSGKTDACLGRWQRTR